MEHGADYMSDEVKSELEIQRLEGRIRELELGLIGEMKLLRKDIELVLSDRAEMKLEITKLKEDVSTLKMRLLFGAGVATAGGAGLSKLIALFGG